MEQLIQCVAVDDDAPALRVIEQYISRLPHLKLAAKFRSPVSATDWLSSNKADILFLDIQMPQQNGMTMLQLLNPQPLTVFTTAYTEFAADAFDLDAIDYLRKPFSFDRFCHAVDKAKEYLTIIQKKNSTPADSESTVEEGYITIKTNGVIVKLFVKDILYIEGFQEYVKIHTTEKRHVIYERMKNMEKLLPPSFFMRIHKSYIVNTKHVKSINGNMLSIHEHEVPVSRDMKEEVIKRIF